jgi:hypothetical protein
MLSKECACSLKWRRIDFQGLDEGVAAEIRFAEEVGPK